MSSYTIGVDFGTESGRAVLVDVADGRELATHVYAYSHGVIDEALPGDGPGIPLEPDWALQDPEDYLRVFQVTVPAVVQAAGVDPADVVGIGIDFTACTMLPTKADGTPLCVLPEFRSQPHAWVKLWKHHAAQPEADRINAVARATNQGWLDRYGGKISSRVVLLQGTPDPRRSTRGVRGRRPPDRGCRLGRVAPDRRWTRNSCWRATRRSGPSATGSRARTTSGRSIRGSRMSWTRG